MSYEHFVGVFNCCPTARRRGGVSVAMPWEVIVTHGGQLAALCLRVAMGIASNEAEEAGASSLFCVRTHARIGDVL